MNIKIVEITDIDNLFELNKAFGIETTKEKMKSLIESNTQEIICIAYINGVAVGYCTGLIIQSVCYNEKRMDIESLFVKEEYRKTGVGKALLEFIEKEAIAKKISHFHIITERVNMNAKSLFKKLGFEDTNEILLDKTL
jgi:ribosomal protein S18 acetylase RimI-like enzyme